MEKSQATVSLVMTGIICFIGFPVWWNTTKTYRVGLPYDEILSLVNSSSSKVGVHWDVFVDKEIETGIENGRPNMLSEFELNFKKIMEGKLNNFNTSLSFIEFVVPRNIGQILKWLNSSSESILSKELYNHKMLSFGSNHNRKKSFSYDIYFLQIPNTNSKENCSILAGMFQIMVLSSRRGMPYIMECIRDLLNSFENDFYPHVRKGASFDHQKDNHNSIQSAEGYEVAFTLANANPTDIILDWEIDNAIRMQLLPFLQKISMFGPFTISSQVLNFVDLKAKPKQSKNGYYYPIEMVPELLNPLESRLNEYTSNNPIFNFILYSPPVNQMPLRIKKITGNSDSFTSPRWGGVVINNIDESYVKMPNSNKIQTLKLDMKREMLLFIEQFKELIGLKRQKFIAYASYFLDAPPVMEWEINFLLLKKTLENLDKAVSTLSSLAELLEKISNIVIRDDIKDLVVRAVKEVMKSRQFLQGGYLKRAFTASKIAFENSEKAFYDYSLLALLYFPDDQKYAVYLPLFLPMCLPIFLSSVGALKHFKASRKNQKEQ